MYQKKTDEDLRCPLEYAMRLIGGKWKSRIICLLGNIGPMHFGELKSDLLSITDGVLAATLNELVQTGLIHKNSLEDAGSTNYLLTAKGETLIPILQTLCRWADPYYKSNHGIMTGHCKQCDFYKKWSAEIAKEI